MKSLEDILELITHELVQGDYQTMIRGVAIDTRQLDQGQLFIAIKGATQDGHLYIGQAVEKGATAIVCSDLPGKLPPGIAVVKVGDTRKIAGVIAANFYNHPSRSIKLVGVTGTNGKTSIVQLSHRLFTALGYRAGMLSTIENKIGDRTLRADLTTPDAVSLQKMLAEMLASGCTHAFMEVSSHSLDQFRVQACRFSVAVFTNLTHDHLDYHGTFDQYLKTKKVFFDNLDRDAHALVNIDDRNGLVMVQNCRASVRTYALRKAANFKGKVIENTSEGLQLQIDGTDLHCQLVGAFNASNLLAVYAIARMLEQEKLAVLRALSNLQSPAGRMEVVRDLKRAITAFVDYAHTPDALKNVLETILEIRRPGQEVITVVGCGGNRDALKRPVMARLAVQYSDRVILTSDNPRFEDPDQIIREMEAGIPAGKKQQVLSITNRKEAIRTAAAMCKDGGIILVAGKGHENYQEIQGERKPFDDREVLRECFAK